MKNMHRKFKKSKRQSTWGEDSFSAKRPKLDKEYQRNDKKQKAIKPVTDSKKTIQKTIHKLKEIMEKLLKRKMETQIQSATDPTQIDNKEVQKAKKKSYHKKNMLSKRKAKRGKGKVPSKKHKSKDEHNTDQKPGGFVFDRRDPFARTAEDEVRLRQRPSKFFRMGTRKSLLCISAIKIPKPAGPPKKKGIQKSLSKCNKHYKKHFGSKAKSQVKILQIKNTIVRNITAAKGNVTEPLFLTTNPKFPHPKALFLENIDRIKKKKKSPTPFAFVRPETSFWESIDHCDPTEPALPEKRIQPVMHPIKEDNVSPFHVFSDMDIFPYPIKEENVSPLLVFPDMDQSIDSNVHPDSSFWAGTNNFDPIEPDVFEIWMHPIKEEKTSPTPFAFPYGEQSSDRNVVRPETPFWERMHHCDPREPTLPEKRIQPVMHPIKEENVSPYLEFSDKYIFPYPIKGENISPILVFPDMDQFIDSNVHTDSSFWAGTNNFDPIEPDVFEIWMHPIKEEKTSPTPFAFPYGEQSSDRNVVRPDTPLWESIDHCDPTNPDLPEKRIQPLMHAIREENVSPLLVFPDMDQSIDSNVVHPDSSFWAGTNNFDPIEPDVFEIWMHPIKEEKTSPTPFAFPYGEQSSDRNVVRPDTPLWESIDHCDPTNPDLPEKRIQPLMHAIREENVSPLLVFPDMDQSIDSNVVHPDSSFWAGTNNFDPIEPVVFEIWMHPIKEEKTSPTPFAFPYGEQSSDRNVVRPDTPFWERIDNCDPREPTLPEKRIQPLMHAIREENVSPLLVFPDMDQSIDSNVVHPDSSFWAGTNNFDPIEPDVFEIWMHPIKGEKTSPTPFAFPYGEQSSDRNVVRPETPFWERIDNCDPREPTLPEKRIQPLMHAIREENVSPLLVFPDMDQSIDSNVVHPDSSFWAGTNNFDPIEPVVFEIWMHPIKEEKTSPTPFAFPYGEQSSDRNVVRPETPFWERIDNCDPREPTLPEKRIQPLMHAIREENVSPLLVFPDMDQSIDSNVVHPDSSFWAGTNNFDPIEPVVFEIWMHPIKEEKTSPTPFAFPYGEQSSDRNVVRPETPFWESIDHCDPTNPDLPEKRIQPLMHAIREENVSPLLVFPDMDQSIDTNVVHPDSSFWAGTNNFDPIEPDVFEIWMHPIKEEKTSPTPFAFPYGEQSSDRNVVRPDTPFWERIDNCDPREPTLPEKRIQPLMHAIREENVSPLLVFPDMDQSIDSNVVHPDSSFWAGTNNFDPIEPDVFEIWMHPIKEEKTSPTPFAFPYGEQSSNRNVVRPETPFWERIDNCDPREPTLPEKTDPTFDARHKRGECLTASCVSGHGSVHRFQCCTPRQLFLGRHEQFRSHRACCI
ncbi:uncharacterized protein [Drosophila pseudoobscura]|uniref:Uncharacterized protein isoform X1 n=1 Tax=Drosophila pseudoobscura pseudoobscura TaxID=46245 RepID=A0A6I8V0S7_DROPS|nr:uncharacterized protein LOC6901737 isoform X1 [Drosophila pseudoobscura]